MVRSFRSGVSSGPDFPASAWRPGQTCLALLVVGRYDPLMAVGEFGLPIGQMVRLVYLERLPNSSPLNYLQLVRSQQQIHAPDLVTAYRNMVGFYARKLSSTVTTAEIPFDAVVSPPSSRDDATPYREAIVGNSDICDLTTGFSRKGAVRAATACSVDEIVDEFEYAAAGCESRIKSLLIVDESIASGRTVAAILVHLRRVGLPTEAQVSVAVAAWIAGSRGRSPSATGPDRPLGQPF